MCLKTRAYAKIWFWHKSNKSRWVGICEKHSVSLSLSLLFQVSMCMCMRLNSGIKRIEFYNRFRLEIQASKRKEKKSVVKWVLEWPL